MILLIEEICPDKYKKLFDDICINTQQNVRLNSCSGAESDSVASASFEVSDKYLKVFENKIQKMRDMFNIRITDVTSQNKDSLEEGWRAFYCEILAEENTSEESQSKPAVDENTVKRFIELSKRLNKQLFFKDKNGSMKRVAPSKYDTITLENFSHIYINKTGKEEGCLSNNHSTT